MLTYCYKNSNVSRSYQVYAKVIETLKQHVTRDANELKPLELCGLTNYSP
jgi:hypothetical protein